MRSGIGSESPAAVISRLHLSSAMMSGPGVPAGTETAAAMLARFPSVLRPILETVFLTVRSERGFSSGMPLFPFGQHRLHA